MSNDPSDVTGLPEELGIGEDLDRTEQRLSIRTDSRRYGKPVTIVEGFDGASVDLEALASTLKSRLAVDGTVTDSRIELQGEHDDRLREILRDEAFTVEG